MLLVSAAFLFSARTGLLTPDEAEMRARYSLPGSRFLDLDGQTIHLADQGSGIPVILIHGSYGSLLNWNDWVQDLAADYRVIRFDLPRAGLSGPSPDGRYGPDANMRIINALSRELQLEQVNLAEQRELLGALMKSPGPFYQYPDGSFQQDTAVFDDAAYLDALEHVPVYVARGRVDFSALSERCLSEVLA